MSINGIPPSFCRAIRFQDPDIQALQNIADAEWERILSTWSTAKIMTSYRLDHRDGERDFLPHWVGQRIDRNLADVELRFQKIKSAYARVADELKDIGADHVMMKGFSLFPGYVREFGFRPQGDIDLYCPPECVHRAQDAVVRLGYVPVTGGDQRLTDHLPTAMPVTSWKPGRNLFDPEMPIGFELHYRFWNEEVMRFDLANLDEFWHRRVWRNVDGFQFPGLHPVDNLGYTALNTLRDLSRGLLPIEQIYGMARFLNSHSEDAAFWELWRQIHGPSLRRLEAISFRLAANWFACKLPEEIREEIERQPASLQSWFRETSEAGHFPRVGEEKNGTWLHVLLLESIKDKLGILREVLFGVGSSPNDGVAEVAEPYAPNGEPERGLAAQARKLLSYPIWFVSRSVVRLAQISILLRLRFQDLGFKIRLGKGILVILRQ